MFETVRNALRRPDRRNRYLECRHCGTGLAHTDAECPSCESTDVAAYDLQ